MKTKATHSGHCQICGSLQKLPNGVLAKHGYTVEYGWFNGVCPGSEHKPFEESTALIQQYILTNTSLASNLEAESADIKAGKKNEGTKAKKSFRGTASTGYKSYFGTVELSLEESNARDGVAFFATDDKGVKTALFPYIMAHGLGACKTVSELQTAMNGQYAEATLDRRAAACRDWVKWQEKRLVGWAPAPLVPVKEEAEGKRIEVGSRVKLSGSEYEVTALTMKIAKGVSWKLNGQYLEHATLRSKAGKEFDYPTRCIRTVLPK